MKNLLALESVLELADSGASGAAARRRGNVLEREPIATGVTGVDRFTVYFPALRRSIRIKWKAAPPGDADGWKTHRARSSPPTRSRSGSSGLPPTSCRRRWLAACGSRTTAAWTKGAEPTFPGTDCVFGIQALWLENVEVPEPLHDEARFREERVYARHLANFNLFAYLIDDRDTRPSNILTSKDLANRRVFSVDNGISFDSRLYNIFENEWKDIRVPALPRDSIDRLRSVTRERVESLGTVAQFRVDREGMLRPERAAAPIDPERGSRFQNGVLQLGLTRAEIDGVWERLQKLLARIDAGEITLLDEESAPLRSERR